MYQDNKQTIFQFLQRSIDQQSIIFDIQYLIFDQLGTIWTIDRSQIFGANNPL